MKKNIEVFLGGTMESDWRKKLIKDLKCDYFDPYVEDWNEAAQKKELEKRENCDYVLYVLTPKLIGYYSIFEVVEDSCKNPKKTLFCYLEKDGEKEFNKHQLKSFKAGAEMIERNGAKVFKSLNSIAEFLNNANKIK